VADLGSSSERFENLYLSDYYYRSVSASVTASTTQTQGQGALTAEVNNLSTVANPNDTVTLAAAEAGLCQTINNNGASTAQIFPASGDAIAGGSVDAATTLAAGSNITYCAHDGTNWEIEATSNTGGGYSNIGPWHAINLANSQTDSTAAFLSHNTSGDTGKKWSAIRAGTITGVRVSLSSINAGNDGTLKISVLINTVEVIDNAVTITLLDTSTFTPVAFVADDDIEVRWTTSSWGATSADMLVWFEQRI
jgi:hypothetical protein